MKSIKQLFFLVLFFILSISSISAHTQESDESRKLKAESADKHIRFISPAEFSVHINKGLWIIMFGANWCTYTQKLTPKWLGLQTRIRAENLSRDINIAKVECTKYMDFCKGEGIDGFPTVYVYENGKKYEEYTGNHEINEMFTYVQEQVARFKSEEVVEEVVTVYVEEVVYEDEMEENKPRKSSADQYEQQNQQEQQNHQEQQKAKAQNSKQLPKKRNAKNPPPPPPPKNKPNDYRRVPTKKTLQPKQQPRQQHQGRDLKQKYKTKQAPKYIPPKNAPPKYAPPKYAPPKYDKRPLPPKKPNVVVKATKKVFGLVESIITLAVVLIVIYAIVRFKAIKRHSSYSKTKIPLYRDLTQEEKYMLHYS